MEYGQVSHYIEGIGGSIQLRRIHKIALDDPRRQQSLELAAIVTNAVFDQPSDPIGYVHEILEASYSIQTRRIV